MAAVACWRSGPDSVKHLEKNMIVTGTIQIKVTFIHPFNRGLDPTMVKPPHGTGTIPTCVGAKMDRKCEVL